MDTKYSASALCVLASAEQNRLIKSAFEANKIVDALIIDDQDVVFDTMRDGKPVLAIIEDVEEKLDGIELVRSIRRSDASPNIRIPILLIISDATQKRVLKACSVGANRILTTPFDAQKCWEQIEETLTDTRTFVITDDYVGPERRGKGGGDFTGKNRRLT